MTSQRVLTLALLSLSTVCFLAFVAGQAACQTDAEPPNADFGRDGGVGDLGEPCRANNQCNDVTTLVCVQEESETQAFCRTQCDTTANDPCGAAFTCILIGEVDAGTA